MYRVDLAGRLKARQRALRTRLSGRDALLDAIRSAHASTDPRKVAGWLVREAGDWVAAPCWAVVATDVQGRQAVLADAGLTPEYEASLALVASWVMREGRELLAADLASDERGAPIGAGSAVAFPLLCRGRTIGVLAALDARPSASAPQVTPALRGVIGIYLESPAVALESALALQRAEALSVTDDLTRVYNSRYLRLVLRREVKRASRGSRPLSLLFIDLDGFKAVNDTYGHLAGSKVLVEAAAAIRNGARETDMVARFGGDEFCLVLPDTGSAGAVSAAERIRDMFREHRFLVAEGSAIQLTCSIGVATLPDVAGSAEELLRAADTAMYKVKGGGKNGIHVAREEGSSLLLPSS
ncbi:MAG: diguanylate cyclase [Vicinamibacterales bacterium]